MPRKPGQTMKLRKEEAIEICYKLHIEQSFTYKDILKWFKDNYDYSKPYTYEIIQGMQEQATEYITKQNVAKLETQLLKAQEAEQAAKLRGDHQLALQYYREVNELMHLYKTISEIKHEIKNFNIDFDDTPEGA